MAQVEGKVKTTQGNFSLEQHFSKLKNCCEKFNGISSNIFVQLYYKHLLFIILKNNKTDTSTLKISNAFLKNKNSARKIGNNGIVLNAIDRIRNATNVYYVAILPNNKQTDFKQMISELNETVFKGEQIPIKNVHSIYWGNIENIFPYGIVKDNFTYNKGQIY